MSRSAFKLGCARLLVCLLASAPSRLMAAGDVGAAFTESSAAVLAGALEMASVEPSSGVLRANLPVLVPSARGGAQPGLVLNYSSAAGIREAGMGWGLNLPMIERRGPFGGPPDYHDDPSVEPILSGDPNAPEFEQHRTELARMTRFVFNGEPLVSICEADSVVHPCPAAGGSLPDWVRKGWLYFRLAVC